jgi:hypothetical protein
MDVPDIIGMSRRSHGDACRAWIAIPIVWDGFIQDSQRIGVSDLAFTA